MQEQMISQVLSTIQQANNILVTVKRDPSVDELAAAVGLTLALNKADKHATTVFSGKVPSTIEFLQPETVIETTTDSLRDFIISLDKSKADKLRYKVEDSVVRIFITPYRSSITSNDLEFTQGDFNVDAVVAIGVTSQLDIDEAITAHGRILHDASVVSVTKRDVVSQIGSLNWQEPRASSVCEMIAQVVDALDPQLIDGQMATAFLTGVVAETDRFRNQWTSPDVMTLSSRLMSAGANQQLIAEELEKPEEIELEEENFDEQMLPSHEAERAAKDEDGTLAIDHEDDDRLQAIHIDDDGTVASVHAPQPSAEVVEESEAETNAAGDNQFEPEPQKNDFMQTYSDRPFSMMPPQEAQMSELEDSGPIPEPNINRMSESAGDLPHYEPLNSEVPESQPATEASPQKSELIDELVETDDNESVPHADPSVQPQSPPEPSLPPVPQAAPPMPTPPPMTPPKPEAQAAPTPEEAPHSEPTPPQPEVIVTPQPQVTQPKAIIEPQHESSQVTKDQPHPEENNAATSSEEVNGEDDEKPKHHLLGAKPEAQDEAATVQTMRHTRKSLEPISDEFKKKPVERPINPPPAAQAEKHPDQLHNRLDAIRHSIDAAAKNKLQPQQNIGAMHVDLQKDEEDLRKQLEANAPQDEQTQQPEVQSSSTQVVKPQPLTHVDPTPTPNAPPAVPPPLMPPGNGPQFYDADGKVVNPLAS